MGVGFHDIWTILCVLEARMYVEWVSRDSHGIGEDIFIQKATHASSRNPSLDVLSQGVRDTARGRVRGKPEYRH